MKVTFDTERTTVAEREQRGPVTEAHFLIKIISSSTAAKSQTIFHRHSPESPKIVESCTVKQTVGLCDQVTLDGRTSYSEESATLSATWGVSADESTSNDTLAAASNALAPFNGSLFATFNATKLEIGVTFTFSLTVANDFSTDMASTSVVRR